MPPSIKRFFTGLSDYVQKDLLSLLRSNESTVPTTNTVPQADALLSHTQAFFPAYEPTPEDDLIVRNLSENISTDPLNTLVATLYTFDKHYMFSQVPETLISGDRLSKELTARINTQSDKDLRDLLLRNMWGDDRSELVLRFPWLSTRGKVTPYSRLIEAGETPENAKVWLGTINGLRDLMARIYIAANAHGELLVWANDYDRARYYSRFRKDNLFSGVALPPALYAEVDKLADVIDGRGFKKALVLGKSDYSIVRRALENGDCMYTVHRHDTPMISFFFANKQAS